MSRLMILVCAVLSGPALGQDHPASTELPIEHFTRHDEFGTIKIAPDGRFVALTMGKHGRSDLAFIDLGDKKLVSVVRAPDFLEIHDFHWVSTTRLIYLIAERRRGLIRPSPTGEILAINRDGHGHQLVYGIRAGLPQAARIP